MRSSVYIAANRQGKACMTEETTELSSIIKTLAVSDFLKLQVKYHFNYYIVMKNVNLVENLPSQFIDVMENKLTMNKLPGKAHEHEF